MSRFTKISYAVTAAVVLFAGCADERPPRSFVQPNVIKKTDLGGTYYYLQTVTDAPPTNGSMFMGQSSSLMKIRFDVTEDFLFARRAFQQIYDSEDAAAKDPKNYKGAPLAAWRISSHFDIIRDFNSTTGEQTNRIIESVERPWTQREFVRVDWSQNLVTDYVGIGLDLYFSDVQVQPVSYWVSDPTHPDALHLERSQSDNTAEGFARGEMTYLDITDQMIVTPEQLHAQYEENGQIHHFSYPRCFFYYQQDDCASQRIKLRHSFAKIGPNHDYEPRKWDGLQMQLFGVWDVDLRRLTYDSQYGVTRAGSIRHAARFNVWQKAYQADGKTLIDFKDRKVHQTAYYAEGSRTIVHSGDPVWPDGVDSVYPEDLYPEFKEVIKQWDDAMKVAVYVDLKAMPKSTDLATLESIFIACHNPVRIPPAANPDPAGCYTLQNTTYSATDPGTWQLSPDMDAEGNIKKDKNDNPIFHARQGDPRRSTIFWVNQQQNAGPLGYGPPMYDQETGETISGQAYIYGANIETYTARSRDLILLQNGELTSEDYAGGVNVQDYINQKRAMANMQFDNGAAHQKKTFEKNEVLAMSQAMDFNYAKAFSPNNGYPPLDTSSPKALKASINNREKKIHDNFFSRGIADRQTRLQRISGTPLERMMVTPEVMAASGVSPAKRWDELSTMERSMSSPVRAKVMAEKAAKDRMRAEMVGVDFATFDDPGLAQSIKKLTDKYGPQLQPHAEEIRQEMRKEIFLGVTLHEMGHNVGCRHNFRASYDAMNYHDTKKDKNGAEIPGYWQLRMEAINHPDQGMKTPDGRLHSRYINIPGGAVTRYEADHAIRELQYSSIMDYGAEFNSDLHGLGLYDKALIKFSYAEFVEVFTDNKTDDQTLSDMGSLHTFQSALGFPSPLSTKNGLGAIPYHKYPDMFKSGIAGIYQREDVPYSDILEKQISTSNTDLITSDSQGRPLVPYYFCSDEFAGNLTCQRFDAGPDPYEQITDVISRYHNYYVSNNFARNRQTFHSSLGYMDRIKSRYLDKLREQLTWYVLLRTDFQSYLSDAASLNFFDPKKVIEEEHRFFTNEDEWGSFTIAVSLGFDTLGQILTTPGAGFHVKTTSADGVTIWKQWQDRTDDVNDPRIKTIGLIDGRYIDTSWDYTNCGYYWAEECQTRIGYTVDKTLALDVLSDSQAYFTGRDTNTDVRRYAIGYILPYKAQIEEKFGALFSNDFQSLAPYFKRVNSVDVPIQPSWTLDDPTVVKANPIDPAAGFTIQLYAGVYGMSAFPTTFDHDYIDTTKIFVLGNGEASTPDATIQTDGTRDKSQLISNGGNKTWFVVDDTPSGKVFAAHATVRRPAIVLDGDSPTKETKTVALRNDSGVRMLEKLQALVVALAAANALDPNDPLVGYQKPQKVAAAQLEYQNFRQNVEVMRSLHNAFGYGPYKTDAPFYY